MVSNAVDQHVEARHRIELSWSLESEAWVACFPDLRGCLAHGETPEAALHRGREMKRLWVEAIVEAGGNVPAPTLYQDD